MPVAIPERRPEPICIKAKGLLERRGSSASLTIELAPPPESPPHIVTPTRECTAEEFLLSAGNVLSRAQLKKAISDPASLHKEFWEVPLNLPEKLDICGSGVKNRYCSVLPNPQSRVVLPGSADDPLSSYINANYIRVRTFKTKWNTQKLKLFKYTKFQFKFIDFNLTGLWWRRCSLYCNAGTITSHCGWFLENGLGRKSTRDSYDDKAIRGRENKMRSILSAGQK